MMHMDAHCAHSGPSAMQVHMHIYPLGYVQYVQHPPCTVPCSSDYQRKTCGGLALARTVRSRVGESP
jgi:hypothetical protein